MANTIALKRRIGSVKNTKQITGAMELVAASKMRRAQEHAQRTRDYYNMARQILTRLRELTDVNQHPLYRNRKIKTRLHILISSDQGLAGAYNANLFKQFTVELRKDRAEEVYSQVIVVGRQGARFVSKLQGVEIIAAYEHFAERPTADDIRPILNTIIDRFMGQAQDNSPDAAEDAETDAGFNLGKLYGYKPAPRYGNDNRVDAVDVIFTDYKTSISQVVKSMRLLPAAFQEIEIEPDLERAVFEPSVKAVLENVTERLIEAQLNQAFSEALASEHAMRMVAMKNATDNASDLIDDLTLAFNTARQASITQELAEITSGAEAMK
jgi:F-type H+-transporting ATPase subunit gamma